MEVLLHVVGDPHVGRLTLYRVLPKPKGILLLELTLFSSIKTPELTKKMVKKDLGILILSPEIGWEMV